MSSMLFARLWIAGITICAFAQDSPFTVLKQLSAKGGYPRGDQFVAEEERSSFTLPQDKEMVVFFQWAGPVGKHTLEGAWRAPDGRIVEVSPIELETVRSPFAAFWRYILNANMAAGDWILEVKIDGKPAGQHKFRIVSEVPPASPPQSAQSSAPPSTRPALTTKELYDKLSQGVVRIEKLDDKGLRLGLYLGFAAAENVVATAYQAIDGAASLRIIGPKNERLTVDSVVAWSRRHDWALLPVKFAGTPLAVLPISTTWNVGDVALVLDVQQAGGLVIGSLNIAGKLEDRNYGIHLALDSPLSPATTGGPLFNLNGEVIGVIGASTTPGLAAQRMYLGTDGLIYAPSQAYIIGFAGSPRASATSASMIPKSSYQRPPTSMAEMMAQGSLTPLVSRSPDLNHCLMSRSATKKEMRDANPEAIHEFVKGAEIALWATWLPRKSRKAVALATIHDLDNRVVARSLESKLSLPSLGTLTSQIAFTTSQMPAGRYRADLLLDGSPTCRAFFSLTE